MLQKILDIASPADRARFAGALFRLLERVDDGYWRNRLYGALELAMARPSLAGRSAPGLLLNRLADIAWRHVMADEPLWLPIAVLQGYIEIDSSGEVFRFLNTDLPSKAILN